MSDLETEFENLNLHISRAEKEGTFVAAFKDNSGNVLANNEFTYTPDTYILSRFEDKSRIAVKELSEQMKNCGQELFNTVFAGQVAGYFKSLDKQSKDIRLRLFFKKDEPELLRLPWEFMHDGTNYLSAYPPITFSRMLEGISPDKKDIIEGKIRILVVVSMPADLKDYSRLQVENEQMLVMQALDRAHAENKVEIEFLDEASLRNIQARLDEEEFHILHYTGHGAYSNQENKGYLILEDDSGKSCAVDNEKIAALLAGCKTLRLVVLSGCQTAKTSGIEALTDLATPLLYNRIPAVIAMQYSVSDKSANELAQKLYTEIGNGTPVDMAVTRARRELLLDTGYGVVEFATPVLYSCDSDCLKAVPKDETAGGLGRKISIERNVSLRLEQLGTAFIGRRRELRRIKDNFFQRGIRMVVLHGIGGIGKTVTATKLAERLGKNFEAIYAFDCREKLTAEIILVQLNEFFKMNGNDVLEQAVKADIPVDAKIDFLTKVLSQLKLLLIFDNFETYLPEEKDRQEITDPELKKALKILVNGCRDGTRFLFTSRYTFNLLDGRLTNIIDEINLAEMSRPEAIMIMNKFPDIGREDVATKLEIFEKIGGHPYYINMFGKQANETSVQDVLVSLSDVEKKMVEFTLLDRSYKRLGDKARKLINAVAVLKKPVNYQGLEWFAKNVTKSDNLKKDIEELIHWGMIVKLEEEALFQVHMLVKGYIKSQAGEPDWKKRMIKAAEYYEDLVKTTKSVWDRLDARDFYYDAGEFDKAGDIVRDIMEYLHRWGFIEYVTTLNEETITTTSGLTKSAALHHLGMIHQGQGDYDRALEKYNESLKINEELGDKSGIAITLHQLGNIHYIQGDYSKALEKYNKSLKIAEELDYKLSIAHTLHQLGMIHAKQGDYDKALEKYNESLKIDKEIGDKSGIAYTLHQLANIHYDQGDYDGAFDKYNASLKISEELGDKSGIALSIGQIGKIYETKKQYKKALMNYLFAYSEFEQLKSPNKDTVAGYMKQLMEKMGKKKFEKLYKEVTEEIEKEGFKIEY